MFALKNHQEGSVQACHAKVGFHMAKSLNFLRRLYGTKNFFVLGFMASLIVS